MQRVVSLLKMLETLWPKLRGFLIGFGAALYNQMRKDLKDAEKRVERFDAAMRAPKHGGMQREELVSAGRRRGMLRVSGKQAKL